MAVSNLLSSELENEQLMLRYKKSDLYDCGPSLTCEREFTEKELNSQYPPLAKVNKNSHVTLILTTENFTDEYLHRIGYPAKISKMFSDGYLSSHLTPILYCSGSSMVNDDYVSVMFSESNVCSSIFIYMKVRCIVSVLDCDNNKRFTQTLDFDKMVTKAEVGFGKYISRETLLEEPEDLLPCDTLTLHVEVSWELLFLYDGTEVILDYCYYEVYFEYYKESGEFFLKLDSDLGKRLRKESEFFQEVSEIRKRERNTPKWIVHCGEFPAFLNITHVLMGSDALIIDNVDDIYSMYVVANKYKVPPVILICRNLFEKCMSDENVDKILFLAETQNDAVLKCIVERFSLSEEAK